MSGFDGDKSTFDVACSRSDMTGAKAKLDAANALLLDPAWCEKHPVGKAMIIGSFAPAAQAAIIDCMEGSTELSGCERINLADVEDAGPGLDPAAASLLAYRDAFTVLVSEPKAGKTSLCAAAAIGLSKGEDWLTGEDVPGGPKRTLWLRKGRESSKERVRRSFHEFGGKGVVERRDVELYDDFPIKAVAKHVEKNPPENVGLVVVDAIGWFLPEPVTADGNMENNSAAAHAVFSRIDDIRKACGDGVPAVVIHHAKRNTNPGEHIFRGSGAFHGDADLLVEMTRAGQATKAELKYSGRTGLPRGVRVLDLRGKPGRHRYEHVKEEPSEKKNRWDEAVKAVLADASPPKMLLLENRRQVAAKLGTSLEGGAKRSYRAAVERLRKAKVVDVDGPTTDLESVRTSIWLVETKAA